MAHSALSNTNTTMVLLDIITSIHVINNYHLLIVT